MARVELRTWCQYPPENGVVINNFNGTVWGKVGILFDDGDSVQCHACGQFFKLLSNHVNRWHGVSADQYRYAFALNRTQPLCSELYSAELSIRMKKLFDMGLATQRLTPAEKGECPANKSHHPRARHQAILEQKLRLPPKYLQKECSQCGNVFQAKVTQGRSTCSDVCEGKAKSIAAQKGNEIRWVK